MWDRRTTPRTQSMAERAVSRQGNAKNLLLGQPSKIIVSHEGGTTAQSPSLGRYLESRGVWAAWGAEGEDPGWSRARRMRL